MIDTLIYSMMFFSTGPLVQEKEFTLGRCMCHIILFDGEDFWPDFPQNCVYIYDDPKNKK